MASSLRRFKETSEMRSLGMRRLRAHRYFPYFIIGLFIIGAACIHIWQRVVVMRMVMEVALLEKENKRLFDETQKVRTDVAALSMIARLETYALDTLGLNHSTVGQVFTLVPQAEEADSPPMGLADVVTSITRVVPYFPGGEEATAAGHQLEQIWFETEDSAGAGE